MKIDEYIEKSIRKKKGLYIAEIEIEEGFCWGKLDKLCDLSIPKKALHVTWGTILYAIAEKFHEEKEVSILSPKILDFLIENEIALLELSHIWLSSKYLLRIYEKNPKCWEALRKVEEYERKNKEDII